KSRLLPGLVSGSTAGAVALDGDVQGNGGTVSGSAGVVLGGGMADVLLVPVGDDIAVVEQSAGGVKVDTPRNLDPTRRAARVDLDGAPAEIIPGARQVLIDLARTILSAE